MDSSQKLIKSSEIPREQPYQILMQSNQPFISYRAHKLFRRPKWPLMAWWEKKYMGRIAQAHHVRKSKVHAVVYPHLTERKVTPTGRYTDISLLQLMLIIHLP